MPEPSPDTISPLKDHCECPDEGELAPGMASWYDPEKELPFVNHQPGECKCTNDLKQYNRFGVVLTLCSCCWMPDVDKPL